MTNKPWANTASVRSRARLSVRRFLLRPRHGRRNKVSPKFGKSAEGLLDHLRTTRFLLRSRTIDHIIPLSVARNKWDFQQLQRYENLQVLELEDNYNKADKVPETLPYGLNEHQQRIWADYWKEQTND